MTVVYTRTHANPGIWVAPGRTPVLSQARDTLVYGSYIPGTSSVGVLPGTLLQTVEGSSAGGINISQPGVYRDQEFWGMLSVTAEDVIFENCAFRGMDPRLMPASQIPLIKAYGPNHKHFEAYDCTFDPMPWITQRGVSSLDPYSAGIQGSDYKIFRSEITNVQDGIVFTGHDPSNWQTQQTVIVANWIHKMYYRNAWYGPSDGRTHSDVIQFGTGRNLLIEHNMLGGHRDMVGYRTWPGGYNSGDDAFNAALMMAQQVSMEERYLLKDITINHNWLGGGTATVNHPFSTARPNTFASLSFTNNIFFPRGADWAAAANGPGTYDSFGGAMLVGSSIQSTYSGNTWLDGTPLSPTRTRDQ